MFGWRWSRRQARAEEARGPLEAKLLQRPDDLGVISQLAWVYLALERNTDALRLGYQRAASLPIEKDAYWGPSFETGLAEIQARAGEPHKAVKTLRRLLKIPAGSGMSLQRLKIDPVWDRSARTRNFSIACRHRADRATEVANKPPP